MTFFTDVSQVQAFAADLGRVEGRIVPEVAKVVKRAGQNVKDETRARVSSHPSWKRLASSVNYDVSGLEVEVGYDDRGQGELAGIYEFGSSRRAPHPTLIPVAQAEEERFVEALAKVAGTLL